MIFDFFCAKKCPTPTMESYLAALNETNLGDMWQADEAVMATTTGDGENAYNHASSGSNSSWSEPTLEQQTAYFGDYFFEMNMHYRMVHGHLSLLVCFFGLIANFLNVAVLTR